MTAPIFDLTSQCQKVSRLPTEPPGRPACDEKVSSRPMGKDALQSSNYGHTILKRVKANRV